jgi:hypothetical protein
MQLIKRSLRPIYRSFVERPLWWFLAKVKTFFLAEIGVQISQIDERVRRIEANNAAQWDALEQLLLAMLRQPEVRLDSNGETVVRQNQLMVAEQGRTYERNDIR